MGHARISVNNTHSLPLHESSVLQHRQEMLPSLHMVLDSECSEGIAGIQTRLFKKQSAGCISKWLQNLKWTPVFIAHGHWTTHGWIQEVWSHFITSDKEKYQSACETLWKEKHCTDERRHYSTSRIQQVDCLFKQFENFQIKIIIVFPT